MGDWDVVQLLRKYKGQPLKLAKELGSKRRHQTAREALLAAEVAARCAKVFTKQVKPRGKAKAKPRVNRKCDRIVNLFLSDLHIGSDTAAPEMPFAYGEREERRRLARVVAEAANYKEQYRDRSTLHVYLMGDIIDGRLHDMREPAPLAAQFARALSHLRQAIAYLAEVYPEVKVFCQTGNHGRDKGRHPKRATYEKWDSYETMLYVALEMGTKELKNVEWHIPQEHFCAVPLFDSWLFATHGDTDFHVGNVGAALPMRRIEQQMHTINSTRVYKRVFDVFAVGHVHTSASVQLAAGNLMVNGALCPPNGFAADLGLFTACSQWLWESVPGFPVGDQRRICVGEEDDRDRSLDTIIAPARGLG